jgi:RNA polymerase sigma factor (sigma-70 family)
MSFGGEAKCSTETAALIEQYRRGDQEAARLLFERYVHGLIEMIRSNLDPALLRRFGPEDVAQSVFRSLFCAVKENRVTFERSGDLWAWLLQITFNKLSSQVTHHLAAKRSIAREVRPGADQDGRDDPAGILPSREPSDEDLIALADELDFLFGPGGSPLRRVVEFRLQDLTLHEIAEQLGVSHTTVHRRLTKIGHRLAERLAERSGDRPHPTGIVP